MSISPGIRKLEAFLSCRRLIERLSSGACTRGSAFHSSRVGYTDDSITADWSANRPLFGLRLVLYPLGEESSQTKSARSVLVIVFGPRGDPFVFNPDD